MTAISDLDFTVERLGECRHASPMQGVRFTADDESILYCATLAEVEADLASGGLCPGINESGGTVLGSSRGPQDPAEMVETLVALDIDLLIAIGGDGTLKGANAIAAEARRRGLEIAVVGVPKTIDNDIAFVETTFRFDTAVAEAKRATHAAHSEAEGARNGVGLVKLMGRDSGFIAAFTALVDSQVNFCLVPEVPFTLPGFLRALTARLEHRAHAVVVVAEGAGQDLLPASATVDASGNRQFGDIGVFLRDEIRQHFQQAKVPINLKYIDPGYIIRSVPANPRDAAFCLLLGQSAVHAGMTRRTGMVVGFWTTASRTCRSPWRQRNARRSIPRGRCGAPSSPRPVNRAT